MFNWLFKKKNKPKWYKTESGEIFRIGYSKLYREHYKSITYTANDAEDNWYTSNRLFLDNYRYTLTNDGDFTCGVHGTNYYSKPRKSDKFLAEEDSIRFECAFRKMETIELEKLEKEIEENNARYRKDNTEIANKVLTKWEC